MIAQVAGNVAVFAVCILDKIVAVYRYRSILAVELEVKLCVIFRRIAEIRLRQREKTVRRIGLAGDGVAMHHDGCVIRHVNVCRIKTSALADARYDGA